MLRPPVNVFVYLGSGEEGTKFFRLIEKEAKRRGFINRKGSANMSAFIVDCIKVSLDTKNQK